MNPRAPSKRRMNPASGPPSLGCTEESSPIVSRKPDPEPEAPDVAVLPAVREVPLSYGQQGLWLLERLAPGSGVNTIAAGGRAVSGIELELLRRALAELSSR